MSYQSGDKLTNRYLSNDAFTSLKNKLGGRSITSLGNNRRQKSYRVANQGFDLLDYKSLIYRVIVCVLLLAIILYILPQTRYYVHGYVAQKFDDASPAAASRMLAQKVDESSIYNVAPVFLKTDEFIAKQKDANIGDGAYVQDFVSGDIIGTTLSSSSSTIRMRLFSDAGFKNNFLIEQDAVVASDIKPATTTVSATTSTSTEETVPQTEVVKEANHTYQSFVFEGLGYGQIIAKVPPKTQVNKDGAIYIRTIDGLKPIAKIINVDEDNKSTFTIIYAQLMISPQNIYKVIIK